MGIYSEIKSLIKDLNESKIKQRRMAGEKLQSMLSQPETRRRLAMEVSIPPSQRGLISIAGARRMALAEVWRLIIQSAISAVQAIVDGKSKITESDILMPYKLIRSCDMHDEVEDASIQFSNTKLDKKTTRIVFEYTMEMLENRTTLELAEMTLLQQLAYICSRREYVAYFKPHGEISAILEEVESRILSADGAVESRVTEEAGKLFGNIVKTTIDLGIGLEILIPGCVKMAANWCKLNKAKNLVSELPHVLNGLSLILESNPEQSVAPLFRYGHIILSFVQKRYSNTVGMHRNALNKYLLRHL